VSPIRDLTDGNLPAERRGSARGPLSVGRTVGTMCTSRA